MKTCTQTTRTRGLRRHAWLLGASIAIVALGAGAAPPSAPAPAPPARVLYDFIQMTDRPDLGLRSLDLNDKGQATFAELDENGSLFARFWDGAAMHTVSEIAFQSVPVLALNNAGQVAGQGVFGENVFRAFRWSRQAGLTKLGTLRGTDESLATDINDQGEVVGVARRADGSAPAHAVLWRPGAGPLDLGLKGDVFPTVRINNAGQVAGTTTGRNGFEQAFSWTGAGGPVLLSERGIGFSDVRDLNASGQIAGLLGRGVFTGYLWTPGRSLLEFTGDGPIPFALNDRGTIAGTLLGVSRGFVWSRERGLTRFGTLAGGEYSIAFDVNNHDQVVGESGTFENARAILWTRQEGLVDLNTRLRSAPSGLQLVRAAAINNRGEILAFTSNNLLLLLVPVPVSAQAPVVGPIKTAGSARVDAPLAFSAAFTDADLRDTHSAVWSWGDGQQAPGTVAEKNGAGSVSGTHTYRAPGIYTVRLTVTDSSGKRSTVSRKLVVCPPGASVAGAGWFVTPPGTYRADPGLSALAEFAFLAPLGQANAQGSLQFSMGGLDLRSTDMRLQGVSAARYTYRGTGTVNGKGSHAFELSVLAASRAGAGSDRIRLRIWHTEPGTGKHRLDYDSQARTGTASAHAEGIALAAGTIVAE